MRIILNSDVIHTNRRWAKGLPPHIKKFCHAAKLAGAVLVLPRTVLLEDERHQTTLGTSLLQDAEKAISALRDAEVELPEIHIPKEMQNVSVVDALRAVGVTVEVEDPNLDDYREAERRASLHLAPHPPEGKSDEMRDLVIWQVALRLAAQDGPALIVSRDEVHIHERGEPEATIAQLLRAKSFDDALSVLAEHSAPHIRDAILDLGVGFGTKPLIREAQVVIIALPPEAIVAPGPAENELQNQYEGLDKKVLGFVAYLGNPSKEELLDALTRSGVPTEQANSAAKRLVDVGMITDTGNHYLVSNREVGEAAANLVESEFIELLEQDK